MCKSHFKNDQIWPILKKKTIMPTAFELDPLFLIGFKMKKLTRPGCYKRVVKIALSSR